MGNYARGTRRSHGIRGPGPDRQTDNVSEGLCVTCSASRQHMTSRPESLLSSTGQSEGSMDESVGPPVIQQRALTLTSRNGGRQGEAAEKSGSTVPLRDGSERLPGLMRYSSQEDSSSRCGRGSTLGSVPHCALEKGSPSRLTSHPCFMSLLGLLLRSARAVSCRPIPLYHALECLKTSSSRDLPPDSLLQASCLSSLSFLISHLSSALVRASAWLYSAIASSRFTRRILHIPRLGTYSSTPSYKICVSDSSHLLHRPLLATSIIVAATTSNTPSRTYSLLQYITFDSTILS